MNRKRLAWAAFGAGAVVAWRVAASIQRRRRLLRRGEIRALHSLWLTVNGCRVHARACTAFAAPGTVPVILVHGWGISGSYFTRVAERLAARFAVYAPDLPGHGASDTPAAPLDVPGLAQALLDWMSRAGIGKAALVGHSMGCQVAVEASIRHPQQIDRLVLVGPTPDPAAPGLGQQLCRFVTTAPYERRSLGLHTSRDYWRMGRRLVPEFRAMLADRIDRKLPRVTVPVLLVRGEKDHIAPQAWIEAAARMLPDARWAVMPEWGHTVHYSAPEQFVDVVRDFLAGPAAKGAAIMRP